jgi:hypothetical protein
LNQGNNHDDHIIHPETGSTHGRALGQRSRAAEDAGDLELALELNLGAVDAFLADGDAPGLLIAFRSQAFLLFKLGEVDAGLAQMARALGLALQMEPAYVMQTLDQVVGLGSYLAREHPTHLVTLAAALHGTIDHLIEQRGPFPTELVGPAELARTLGSIYGARGLLSLYLAGEEALTEAEVAQLTADAMTQAWAVDALSRQQWGIVPWLKAWMVEQGLPVDE